MSSKVKHFIFELLFFFIRKLRTVSGLSLAVYTRARVCVCVRACVRAHLVHSCPQSAGR